MNDTNTMEWRVVPFHFNVILILILSTILINSVSAIEPMWVYKISPGLTPKVLISSDGSYVVALGKRITTFYGGEFVWSGYQGSNIALTDDGSRILAANEGIMCLDKEGNKLWEDSEIPPINDISISQNNEYIALGAHNKISVYSIDGQLVWRNSTQAIILSTATSSEGTRTIVGSIKNLTAFDERGNELWNYTTFGKVNSIFVSLSSSDVIATDDNMVIDLKSTGELRWQFKTKGSIHDLAVTPYESYIVVGGQDPFIYFLNRTGVVLWKYNTNSWVFTVSIDSQGDYIAAGTIDGKILLFNNTGNLLWDYRTEGIVTSIAVSSNGKYLAAVTNEGYVYFFITERKPPHSPSTTTALPTTLLYAVYDGLLEREPASDEPFSDIRNGTGTSIFDSWDYNIEKLKAGWNTERFSQLRRFMVTFNTSILGSSVCIDSAKVGIYGASKVSGLGQPDIGLTNASPSNTRSYSASDYGAFDDTEYANRITFAAWSTSGYNNFTLNKAGINHINKSGDTVFYLRHSWDIDNSFSGWWSYFAISSYDFYTHKRSLNTERPFLEVTYSSPPVAGFICSRTSSNDPIVSCTDSSINSPASWSWERNSGKMWSQFSTVQNPLGIPFADGTWSIRLNVTNDCGNSTITRTDYIRVTSSTAVTSPKAAPEFSFIIVPLFTFLMYFYLGNRLKK